MARQKGNGHLFRGEGLVNCAAETVNLLTRCLPRVINSGLSPDRDGIPLLPGVDRLPRTRSALAAFMDGETQQTKRETTRTKHGHTMYTRLS